MASLLNSAPTILPPEVVRRSLINDGPRAALLNPEPQAGEVTPADAWSNVRDAVAAATDARSFGVEPVAEGMTGRDVLAQYLDPKTGELTEAGQQYTILPGAFVGSSGGPATVADALAQRYHPLNLTAEQLGIPGYLERVSTRIPTVGSTPLRGMGEVETAAHGTATLNADRAAMAEEMSSHDKNASLIARMPSIRIEPGSTTAEALQQFERQVADNLLYLHDTAPQVTRDRGKLWYDGMRDMAEGWSKQNGLLVRQNVGAIAALSPGTEWNLNVERARRVQDILQKQGSTVATKEMRTATAGTIADLVAKGDDKSLVQAQDLQNWWDRTAGVPLAKITDSDDAAGWVRLFDLTHDPNKTIPLMGPEGKQIGLVMNKDKAATATKDAVPGAPTRFAWGYGSDIAKAIDILRNGDVDNISRNLGYAHKVRNFYNNGVSPHAGYDITNDTHAIAGGLMQPLGQQADDVALGLGNGGGASGSKKTGMQGLYGAFADANRLAAAERDMLPRQMQSITWEAARGLFSPVAKRNIRLGEEVNAIWGAYKNGDISADRARAGIRNLTGGIQPPSWSVPSP